MEDDVGTSIGMRVVMPKAQFSYDAASGAWTLIAEWSASGLEWMHFAGSGYQLVD